jgi:hypothetical protein
MTPRDANVNQNTTTTDKKQKTIVQQQRRQQQQRTNDGTQSRTSAQFSALIKKNLTLKTRGILCCCTGVEIILPVFFLAVLCLPKVGGGSTS